MRRSVSTPIVATLLVLGCGGNSGADAGLPNLANADVRFGTDTTDVNHADGPLADLSRTPDTSDGKTDRDGGPFSPARPKPCLS
jgi:hypothetical protein